jgi:NAD-dependent deacetylase
MIEERRRLLELIDGSDRIVALTGAGISTASGIPDFRSSGGIWEDVDPMEIATLTAFREDPGRFWGFYRDRLDVADRFAPNPGHYFLAHLAELGKLTAVVTQNIDGLHQAAGVEPSIVHEVHGSVRELECLGCGRRFPRERVDELTVDGLPRCSCGEVLKPAVVLFEEMLPEGPVGQSTEAIAGCDLLLLIGSSLVVYPVAGMPGHRSPDARMAVINAEQTSWGPDSDVWIGGDIAEECAALSEALGFGPGPPDA